MEKRKTWTEPKLIALVRMKPEEGILSTCKSGSWLIEPGGPTDYNTHCKYYDGGCLGCDYVGNS